MTQVISVELGNQPILLVPDTPKLDVDVSVLVPAHNEEETIEKCLKRAATALSSRRKRSEIIVIDDGSTDTTYDCALGAAEADGGQIQILHNRSRCGKGAALMAAAKNAKGEIVVVLDADLEYAPEEIIRLVEPIEQGVSDVVFGSRFMGHTDGMSLSHRLGNRILTWTTNLLYDSHLTDVMTGYKAFSRTALEKLNIGQAGFGFEVESAAKALKNGLRIVEVPITYRRRSFGKSKIKWTDGLRCLLDLIGLARERPAS